MPTTRLTKLLGIAALLASVQVQSDELRIAVAANFTDVARDIIPMFEQATGHSVKASFGSTGKLYAQIEHGAPFEAFLAADSRRPRKSQEVGLAVPGTRFTYAKGKLVMWSAKPRLFDDGEAYLRTVAFPRAAIANPKTAPYGLAAQQVMEHLGVWGRTQSRLVRGDSVAQTFQFTATGNAAIGFVALSQIKAWQGEQGTLWEIPQGYYPPIAQQAVLLKKGESSQAARAFLEFLKGSEARSVITGYGYGVE
jgi:molybdate transport system substrate-binding protein